MSSSSITSQNINSTIQTNNNANNEEENITCYVLCRPLNFRELELNANCIEITKDKKTISLKNYDNKYTYDKIFPVETNQKTIFQEIGLPLVNKFLSGYNTTIFAYGQTGTGKNYTIIGLL